MSDELSLLDQALGFAEERQITLPVFSDVALQGAEGVARGALRHREIERAIESDPALVAEVLRAANSAFFGGLSEVVEHPRRHPAAGPAAGREPGVPGLREEPLHGAPSRDRRPDADLWHHASACALAAEWIVAQGALPAARRDGLHRRRWCTTSASCSCCACSTRWRASPNARQRCRPSWSREVLDNAHADVGYRLLRVVAPARGLPDDRARPPRGACPIRPTCRCRSCGSPTRPATRSASACARPGLVLGAVSEAATLGMTEIAIAELEIILEDTVAAVV